MAVREAQSVPPAPVCGERLDLAAHDVEVLVRGGPHVPSGRGPRQIVRGKLTARGEFPAEAFGAGAEDDLAHHGPRAHRGDHEHGHAQQGGQPAPGAEQQDRPVEGQGEVQGQQPDHERGQDATLRTHLEHGEHRGEREHGDEPDLGAHGDRQDKHRDHEQHDHGRGPPAQTGEGTGTAHSPRSM